MSKLVINVDLKSQQIQIDKDPSDIQPGSITDTTDVKFKFKGDGLDNISHLSFGFFVNTSEGELTQKFKFPSAGTVSAVSESGSIGDLFELEYNTDYTIDVWVQNGMDRIEKTSSFKTVIPPCPYPSWSWSGTAWTPPTPMPTNKKGASFAWSEKLKKWIEIVPPLGQYDDIL